METQVRTPQLVFMLPQRLVVPLFQRPYVWNEESQWEPLWNDVARIADRLLKRPQDKHQPHFLGAVVLQRTQNPVGKMPAWTIIDGQQRLTTLQLLLDALHAELLRVDARSASMRIEMLVRNPEVYCLKTEDRFKVWPTNRDRPAFNAVMGAEPPVDYAAIGHGGERMVQAHRYFSEQARQWLSLDGQDAAPRRGDAIETVARELIQLVVIELAADENAQEIFETLNARGAQLTAADLIKNFVFQRLIDAGDDVEGEYQKNWKDFETAFWETEISVGRVRYSRSSIFLNHWLVARTGEEVVAREVFDRFKRYADHEAGLPMARLLGQVHAAAAVYRDFVSAASKEPVDRWGLFGYRTGVLESEVIKPLVLHLLDPEEPPVPEAQLVKTLDVVESWMVRRMLVRASTKSYSQVISGLLVLLRHSGRAAAGDLVERYFAAQSGVNRYWPDDDEIRQEVKNLPAYRRLSRGRLRMVLEAVEDHLRGWKNGEDGLGGQRVPRGKFAIEHVMPRKWELHWPVGDDPAAHAERERLLHTFGNLTLLTGKMNSKVSNRAWLGHRGKYAALDEHNVLMLNNRLLKTAKNAWTEESVRRRTRELAEMIIEVWPAPEGHKSHFSRERAAPSHKVGLADLMNAGMLVAGMALFPRRKQPAAPVATLLADGRIDVGGALLDSPTEAAKRITGRIVNGWWFFLVDAASRRSLRDVRREYIEKLAVDAEDDGEEEGEDDEE